MAKFDETPSVYITPESDADDVQGHSVRDNAPGAKRPDNAPDYMVRVQDEGEGDVEGHIVRNAAPDMKTGAAPDVLARGPQAADEDDVEGHKKF